MSSRNAPTTPAGSERAATAVPFLGLCLALAAGLSPAGTALAGKADGSLDLYWSDSNGGGSTLLVTPAGESVLVDAGNPGGRDSGRILNVLTNTAGLRRLDHLVITHLHIDHFGGAAEIAAAIPVGDLWDNGLPDTDPDGNRNSTWPLTSKPYRSMPVGRRHRVEPGTVLPLASGAVPISMRCVITRKTPAEVPAGLGTRPAGSQAPELREPDSSDNANSSAWVVRFGNFGFYDGGDLTWNAESTLVWPTVRVPEVDLYQVTHHGLDVSNHPRLLDALRPRVTVMNNGPTKGTAGAVLATLNALPGLEAQFQLHRNTRPDGATNNTVATHIANPTPEGGAVIHCKVSPDSRRYTVSLPATGFTRTFETKR